MPKMVAKTPKRKKGSLPDKSKGIKKMSSGVPRSASEPRPSTSKWCPASEKQERIFKWTPKDEIEIRETSGDFQKMNIRSPTSAVEKAFTSESTAQRIDKDTNEAGDTAAGHEKQMLALPSCNIGIIKTNFPRAADKGAGDGDTRPLRRSARIIRKRFQKSLAATYAAKYRQQHNIVQKRRRPREVNEIFKLLSRRLVGQLIIYLSSAADCSRRIMTQAQSMADIIEGKVNPDLPEPKSDDDDEDSPQELPTMKLFTADEWVYKTPPKGEISPPKLKVSHPIRRAIITTIEDRRIIYEIDPSTSTDVSSEEHSMTDSDFLKPEAHSQVLRPVNPELTPEVASAQQLVYAEVYHEADADVDHAGHANVRRKRVQMRHKAQAYVRGEGRAVLKQETQADMHRIVRADEYRQGFGELTRETQADMHRIVRADLPPQTSAGLGAIREDIQTDIRRLIRAQVHRVIHGNLPLEVHADVPHEARSAEQQNEPRNESQNAVEEIKEIVPNIEDFELF